MQLSEEINELKEEIDNWLGEYFAKKEGYNKDIFEAMYYSLKIGGKRIRPILMLLAYNVFKNDYKDIMEVACAMEMIHTYSLIHDDLPCMDDDDLRRGKPTNHKVFGEAIAVLAGDALLNESMSVMFEHCVKNPNHIEACNIISKAAGANGMIGGQVVDIELEGREKSEITEDVLKYMHNNKTGALIKASLVSGAIMGGATEEEVKLIESYGYKLGLAFQIKDDILDVIGDYEKLGKNINKDKENEKINFISIYGIEKSKILCEKLTKECIETLKKINKNTFLLEELTKYLLFREN